HTPSPVPSLPDPLAFGIALRFTGGGTASGWSHTQLVQYSGSWPDLETYRLLPHGGHTPPRALRGAGTPAAGAPRSSSIIQAAGRISNPPGSSCRAATPPPCPLQVE